MCGTRGLLIASRVRSGSIGCDFGFDFSTVRRLCKAKTFGIVVLERHAFIAAEFPLHTHGFGDGVHGLGWRDIDQVQPKGGRFYISQ